MSWRVIAYRLPHGTLTASSLCGASCIGSEQLPSSRAHGAVPAGEGFDYEAHELP
jgi:hypothetical protein